MSFGGDNNRETIRNEDFLRMDRTKEKPTGRNGADEARDAGLLSGDIQENVDRIRKDFGDCGDLAVNSMAELKGKSICISLYIKGLADSKTIDALSLEWTEVKTEHRKAGQAAFFDLMLSRFSGMRAIKRGTRFESLYQELLEGNTVFLLDGCAAFSSIETASEEGRTITEPTSQTIIKGPKDAFTEDIDKNVFLIRRRIRNPDLRIESLTAGSVTRTRIKLIYISGLAREDIVKDLRDRLNRLEIDAVLDSGYVEEMIRSDRYSIFPTFLSSEKPDAAAAALLEGRAAILVDGTPYVMTVPALFFEFLQASEDYYHHFIISSAIRLLRYIALVLTLMVPATYIALTAYHQEVIPTPLLISIAAQREGLPFPSFVEVFIMELTFEILREAGVRMPRAIGPAISIVGALVLGQAAVEAGIISAVIVIVVSITAISSFAISNYGMSNAIRLLRFALIFIAAILGLYGITMMLIIITLHLCKLKTAGVPYLTSFAPRVRGESRDTFVRYPLWMLLFRPSSIGKDNPQRTVKAAPVGADIRSKPEFKQGK